jgi:uncharacterized membrane protein
MPAMNRSILLFLLLALGFFGIADSWYLAESATNDTPLSCAITALDGCNKVAQSPYAHLLGVPLGAYGVFFYALVFILAAAALTLRLKNSLFYLFVVTGLGAICSLVFIGIQFFLIKALCVYCLASAFMSFGACFAAGKLWKSENTPSPIPVVHS